MHIVEYSADLSILMRICPTYLLLANEVTFSSRSSNRISRQCLLQLSLDDFAFNFFKDLCNFYSGFVLKHIATKVFLVDTLSSGSWSGCFSSSITFWLFCRQSLFAEGPTADHPQLTFLLNLELLSNTGTLNCTGGAFCTVVNIWMAVVSRSLGEPGPLYGL